MFKIGKLFHLTHVVDDLEAVDRRYDDVFSAKRFDNGCEELAGRNASLLAIGDVAMEPVEKPVTDFRKDHIHANDLESHSLEFG